MTLTVGPALSPAALVSVTCTASAAGPLVPARKEMLLCAPVVTPATVVPLTLHAYELPATTGETEATTVSPTVTAPGALIPRGLGGLTAVMFTEPVAKLSPTPLDSVTVRVNGPAGAGALKAVELPVAP